VCVCTRASTLSVASGAFSVLCFRFIVRPPAPRAGMPAATNKQAALHVFMGAWCVWCVCIPRIGWTQGLRGKARCRFLTATRSWHTTPWAFVCVGSICWACTAGRVRGAHRPPFVLPRTPPQSLWSHDPAFRPKQGSVPCVRPPARAPRFDTPPRGYHTRPSLRYPTPQVSHAPLASLPHPAGVTRAQDLLSLATGPVAVKCSVFNGYKRLCMLDMAVQVEEVRTVALDVAGTFRLTVPRLDVCPAATRLMLVLTYVEPNGAVRHVNVGEGVHVLRGCGGGCWRGGSRLLLCSCLRFVRRLSGARCYVAATRTSGLCCTSRCAPFPFAVPPEGDMPVAVKLVSAFACV
jgi:hypothetical protein